MCQLSGVFHVLGWSWISGGLLCLLCHRMAAMARGAQRPADGAGRVALNEKRADGTRARKNWTDDWSWPCRGNSFLVVSRQCWGRRMLVMDEVCLEVWLAANPRVPCEPVVCSSAYRHGCLAQDLCQMARKWHTVRDTGLHSWGFPQSSRVCAHNHRISQSRGHQLGRKAYCHP